MAPCGAIIVLHYLIPHWNLLRNFSMMIIMHLVARLLERKERYGVKQSLYYEGSPYRGDH
jgi:hypothetical protein